jgi:putative addiction module killer protein
MAMDSAAIHDRHYASTFGRKQFHLTVCIHMDTLTYDIAETEQFAEWIGRPRDVRAKARIIARMEMESVRLGNLGDVRPIGDGVIEMRIDSGPGYRIYFTIRRRTSIVLLLGGARSTQERDVDPAKSAAARIE